MKRIRLITIIFSIIFSFFITAIPVTAAENMMDNLLPDQTDKEQEGSVELEYNEHPLSRYGMDTQLEQQEFADLMPWGWDDNIGKQINQGVAMINSTLWGFNKIIAATVGTLVHESFNFDIINDFADMVAEVVQNIAGFDSSGFKSNGLWPYMILVIFVLVGTWAAYIGVIKRAASQALSGILSSIIILTLSLGFFTNVDKILIGINDVASEIQNDVLSFTLSVSSPGEYENSEGIATIRNQIFNLMVKYPWMLLEFGSADEEKVESEWNGSGSRLEAMLSTGIYSKERQDAVKYEVEEMENSNIKPEALTDRLVIIVLVLVMNFIMGGIILLLSLSLVFYQVLALVFAIFTPVALLIGLIPAFSRTAKNIIGKLLHAFYMKIVLALLMTIMFSITNMVYNAIDPTQGYILLFLIQIVCTVVVWNKRHEITNVVSTPFQKFNVNNNTGQNIQEYKQSYFTAKKYMNKIMKPFTTPQTQTFSERTGFNKLKADPGVGAVSPMKHPMYAPVERKENPVKSVDSAVKKSDPAKHSVVNERPTEPVERTKHNEPNKAQQTGPNIDDDNNFESLKSTLDKGGWGHNTKESVQLKTAPVLKDRLSERKAQNERSGE